MRKLRKPRKHADFDNDTSLKKWEVKKFVAAMRIHQHNKCAYCEDHTFDGDMDHYRPKGRIDELVNPDLNINYEFAGLPNMSTSRRVNMIRDYGYPWLTNVWENYLYSCKTCNQRYKRCLFPVQGNNRKSIRRRKTLEKPLLINPCGNINPSRHLKFDYLGGISPRNNSRYGYETILTCGLNRLTLKQRRQEFAEELEQLILEFNEAVSDEAVLLAMKAILKKGEDKKEFCGMIRSLIEDILGMEYDDLLKLVN